MKKKKRGIGEYCKYRHEQYGLLCALRFEWRAALQIW
jgi:hypothetical protein